MKKLFIPDSDKIGTKFIKIMLPSLTKEKLETVRTMIEYGEGMPEKYKKELLDAIKKQYKKRGLAW